MKGAVFMKLCVDNAQTNEQKSFRLPKEVEKIIDRENTLKKELEKIEEEEKILQAYVEEKRKKEEPFEKISAIMGRYLYEQDNEFTDWAIEFSEPITKMKPEIKKIKNAYKKYMQAEDQGTEEEKETALEELNKLIVEHSKATYPPSISSKETTSLSRTPNVNKKTRPKLTSRGALKKAKNQEIEMLTYQNARLVIPAGCSFGEKEKDLFAFVGMKFSAMNQLKGKAEIKDTVEITVEEYAEARGIPLTKASLDKVKKELKHSVDVLFSSYLEVERNGKKGKCHLLDSTVEYPKGGARVRFSKSMEEFLVQAGKILPYNTNILKLPTGDTTSRNLLRKLSEHYCMTANRKRGTHDILTVNSLLDACPDLPTIEEVQKRDRHINRTLLNAIETSLDGLEEQGYIEWGYCRTKKTPITENELKELSVQEKLKLSIQFMVMGVDYVY